jgi:dTDP-4-amino-4,6-dideoxygalactose transaminase
VEARRNAASHYSELLEKQSDIIIPYEHSWAKHAYYVYVIKSKKRDKLAEYLKTRNIQTGIHYPKPVHKQPYILDRFPEVLLPNTVEWAETVLSLPLDPQLTFEEIDFIVSEISDFNG